MPGGESLRQTAERGWAALCMAVRSGPAIAISHGNLIAANVQPISNREAPDRAYLQIDRPVSDGVIVIWQGFNEKHLRLFTQRFPHVRDLMER